MAVQVNGHSSVLFQITQTDWAGQTQNSPTFMGQNYLPGSLRQLSLAAAIHKIYLHCSCPGSVGNLNLVSNILGSLAIVRRNY